MFQNETYDSSTPHDSTEKRRKAIRACTHCQKAHLTCDDSRPCKRCDKRGLRSTCTDAQRKTAKYLMDFSPTLSSSPNLVFPPPFDLSAPSLGDSSVTTVTSSSTDLIMDPSQFLNFSLADLGFGSETAGLEYGFLGNMLDNPMESEHLMNTSANTSVPLVSNVAPCFSTGKILTTIQQHNFSPAGSAVSQSPTYSLQQTLTSPTTSNFPTGLMSPSKGLKPSGSPLNQTNRRRSGTTPEEAYTSVRKPFNYAEGFHYLIQYVKVKMSREDLTRISQALALFRPSFLALIMNLTEQDLVVMEKCIQRTLLEYEKLISFSGTPTVLWRRTGEVCLVGKEFSLLTQWSRDVLLKKKMYIYELMDSRSAVEYWEKFSTHAFDNADSSCIYSCVLHTPQQKPVPCTFCFTIKRDIFDLPSVIVGNFLPILS